jgi:hypothetical protein
VIVAGHHSTPATRQDLEVAKSYVTDVYSTISRILGEDHRSLLAQASAKYRDNGWAIASVLMDDEVGQCANEIKGRWMQKLEGVDIWASSQCRTALVYAEWDAGVR